MASEKSTRSAGHIVVWLRFDHHSLAQGPARLRAHTLRWSKAFPSLVELGSAPALIIANTTITPFSAGSPDNGITGLAPFPEETLTNITPSRTPTANVPGLTQAILTNPNSLLQGAIAGQNITETTVLIMASDPSLMPPSGGLVPAHATAGGGIANIRFLLGGASTGFNANILATKAIFWIETVTNPDGTTFLQLQYTHRDLLVFNGLVWPHVSVATLT